ncbi:MAG: hypothetical protein ACON39_07410 [Coraliomargaritaceae bacterium]
MKVNIPVLLAAGSGLLAIAATSFSSNSAPKLPLRITHDAANRGVSLGFEAKQTDRYYMLEGRTELDTGDWSLSYGIKGDGQNQSQPMPMITNKVFYRLMRVRGDDPVLAIDYDNDKIILLDELDRGLDGFETVPADTDGDTIPNDWEAIHGLNPNDATDAGADANNDGVSNADEFRLGDDPNAEESDRSTIEIAVSSSSESWRWPDGSYESSHLYSYRHDSGQVQTNGHYQSSGGAFGEQQRIIDQSGWYIEEISFVYAYAEGEDERTLISRSSGNYSVIHCTGSPITFLVKHDEHELKKGGYYGWIGNEHTGNTRFEVVHWDGEQLTIDGAPVSLPTQKRGCKFDYGSVKLPFHLSVSSNRAANPSGTHAPKGTLGFTIPSPGNIATGEEQDALDNALVVYYKDVVSDSSLVVKPFEVAFRIPGLSTTAWFETGNNNKGTARGDLQDPISEEATLSIATQGGTAGAPFDGGLYKYTASLDGDVAIPIQVWFPVAGPSIDAAFHAELDSIKKWGIDYKQQLNTIRVPSIRSKSPLLWGLLPSSEVARAIRLRDMSQLGIRLDWYRAPTGKYTPSGGPKNNTATSGVAEHRTTIGGVVVDWPKRNNILYAVVGRSMRISTELLEVGPNLIGGDNNTPDDLYAVASYKVGFRLYNGEGLQAVMADIG